MPTSDHPTLPLVSVVMPIHNAERFLSEAIASVLAQTYPLLELVLIDDGSTDRSWMIAQEYASMDHRVRPFRNERNLGIVKSRNRGFTEACSNSVYYAIMDSDDVCAVDRLACQVEFLERNADHALVGGNTLIIDEEGIEIGRRLYPSSHELLMSVMTRYNPIAQPSVMIRRTALQQVGQYDERYPRCQDYELWLRLASRFKVANLDQFTLRYRISDTQGKRLHLRDSLHFTLQIQRKWLFHRDFLRWTNVVYWAAQHFLLLVPEALVLALFKRVTYRKG